MRFYQRFYYKLHEPSFFVILYTKLNGIGPHPLNKENKLFVTEFKYFSDYLTNELYICC